MLSQLFSALYTYILYIETYRNQIKHPLSKLKMKDIYLFIVPKNRYYRVFLLFYQAMVKLNVSLYVTK